MSQEKLIDTQALAEIPEITEEEAKNAMALADLPHAINLQKWEARRVVGTHLAKGRAGNILIESALMMEDLSVVRKEMKKIIESDAAEKGDKIYAAQTLIKAIEIGGKINFFDLKAAEILGKTGNKERQDAIAPSVHADVAYVQVGDQNLTLERGGRTS